MKTSEVLMIISEKYINKKKDSLNDVISKEEFCFWQYIRMSEIKLTANVNLYLCVSLTRVQIVFIRVTKTPSVYI